MFNKSPLILAIGLAIAAQAGAAITVTPGQGTTNISGTIESQEDFEKIFSSEPSGEDLHYTFKKNVFTTSDGGTGWPSDTDVIRNGGTITLISEADGDFIEASRFELRNMSKLTIEKSSSTGSIFKAENASGGQIRISDLSDGQKRRLDEEGLDIDYVNLEELRLTNTGGSVFEADGGGSGPTHARIALNANSYIFKSEAEDSATIDVRNYQNVGTDNENPLKPGVKLCFAWDENKWDDLLTNTKLTKVDISSAKTAIDLNNTLMQTWATNVDITGDVELENNAYAVFGAYSFSGEDDGLDDEPESIPEGFFEADTYTRAESLQSLKSSFAQKPVRVMTSHTALVSTAAGWLITVSLPT